MKLVVVESPFAGATEEIRQANLDYGRLCLADCLRRGESPIASHLLLTQPGVLDDNLPEQRELGITAGLAWCERADLHVFYVDRGMSPGMTRAMAFAELGNTYIEMRVLPKAAKWPTTIGSGEGECYGKG